MNNDTDKILYAAGPETEEIAMTDPTLKLDDMAIIGRKISECKKLRSLTIADSGLTQDMMELLIQPILQHSSLVKLDLHGNNFTKFEFVKKLVAETDLGPGNPRICELNLRPNQGEVSAHAGVKFTKAVFEKDNLVVLNTDIDPWDYFYADDFTLRNPDKIIERSLNLLEFSCGDWHPSYKLDGNSGKYVAAVAADKERFIRDICKKNRQEATRLLGRVEEAKLITGADIDAISRRLPAIIYLGEKAHGREWISATLRTFYRNAQQQLGEHVDIQRFLSYIPNPPTKAVKKAAPAISVTAAPPAEQRTHDIGIILSRLPVTSEASLRQQIGDALDHPASIKDIGKIEVKTAADLAVASLHIMTAMPTIESAERSMQKFLDTFGTGQAVMESITGRKIQTALAEVKSEIFRPVVAGELPPKGFWATLAGSGYTLTDAGKTIREAAHSIGQANADMGAIAASIDQQFRATLEVSDAYVKIGNQIDQIAGIGRQVLEERHQAAKKAQDNPSEGLAASQTAGRLDLLDAQLEYLQETRDNFRLQLGFYLIHGGLIQKLHQRISALCEQKLSLLDEEISSFANQLDSSSSIQTGMRRNADMDAAMQSLNAISTLTADTLEEINQIDNKVSELRGHVGQLFPAAALTPPPREARPPGVKAAAEAHP